MSLLYEALFYEALLRCMIILPKYAGRKCQTHTHIHFDTLFDSYPARNFYTYKLHPIQFYNIPLQYIVCFFSKSLRILYICMYSTINNYPLNQVHTPAVKKKMAANSPGHAIKLCTFVFIAYISIYMGVIVCSKRRRVNNCA